MAHNNYKFLNLHETNQNSKFYLVTHSTFQLDYFGDSHAESYHILCDSKVGMQARANQSYERLNPLAHNCNWYDILIRVIQTAFHCDIEHQSHRNSQPQCLQSGSELIQNTEIEFLVKLSRSLKSEIEKKRKKRLNQNPNKGELLSFQTSNENEEQKSHVTANERLIAKETIHSLQEKTDEFCKKREQISESTTGEISFLASQMIKETKDENIESNSIEQSEKEHLLDSESQINEKDPSQQIETIDDRPCISATP